MFTLAGSIAVAWVLGAIFRDSAIIVGITLSGACTIANHIDARCRCIAGIGIGVPIATTDRLEEQGTDGRLGYTDSRAVAVPFFFGTVILG